MWQGIFGLGIRTRNFREFRTFILLHKNKIEKKTLEVDILYILRIKIIFEKVTIDLLTYNSTIR